MNASGRVARFRQWRDTGQSLLRALVRSRSEPALVDLQCPDPRFECGSGNAQSRGRAGRSEYLPVTVPQRLLDQRLLVGSQFAGECPGPADPSPRGEPALIDREFVGVAYDHRALNDILQFPHVSRPRISQQPIQGLAVDAAEPLV